MTEKRFHKAYCCGDTGVVDKLENEWFIENINSISDIEKNWDNVIDKLNQVAEENEKLKQAYQTLKHRHSLLHNECLEAECDRDSLKKDVISLEKENENLNNVLEDFMVMLNRLQANPDNEVLQSMAKDMLRMMGKDIMGDVE